MSKLQVLKYRLAQAKQALRVRNFELEKCLEDEAAQSLIDYLYYKREKAYCYAAELEEEIEELEKEQVESLSTLAILVEEWANDRGLVKEENAPKQLLKVMEEVGELTRATVKQHEDEIPGELGDCFVTLIILAAQLGIAPNEALQVAYNKISKRDGKTIDGIFVKEDDLK